ncbi:MAG: hypothetical protein ACREOI_02175 [bacterium]
MPLSLGGRDVNKNICPACPNCNSHKAKKFLQKFAIFEFCAIFKFASCKNLMNLKPIRKRLRGGANVSF